MCCRNSRSAMTNRILPLILTVLGLIVTATAHAEYTLGRSIIGQGGGKAIGTTHNSTVTFGQPVTGRCTGTEYKNDLGFWYVVLVEGGSPPSGIGDTPIDPLPWVNRLGQNAPNPFFTRTSIPFELAGTGPVSLRVYDVRGRVVASLVDEQLQAGHHVVDLDADRLTNGVYFYLLRTTGRRQVKRLVVAR